MLSVEVNRAISNTKKHNRINRSKYQIQNRYYSYNETIVCLVLSYINACKLSGSFSTKMSFRFFHRFDKYFQTLYPEVNSSFGLSSTTCLFHDRKAQNPTRFAVTFKRQSISDFRCTDGSHGKRMFLFLTFWEIIKACWRIKCFSKEVLVSSQ